ncbi:MAG: alpha/beta fold hydrolase [Planctomycetota bacterium]
MRTSSTNSIFRVAKALSYALAVLLLFSGCGAIEHRIIYAPDCYPESWNQPTSSQLHDIVLEDVYFPTTEASGASGTDLHGWLVRPRHLCCEHVILFMHGRSGNVSSMNDRLFEFVRDHEAAVFVFDYRGYGKSGGTPTENGLYSDAAAARDCLAAKMNVPPDEIILFGRSLGSAVAIDLAARQGAKALIVECGFTSAADVLSHHTRGLLNGRRLNSGFASEAKIGAYDGPVFIMHGEDDRIIPSAHGRRLAEAATSASRVEFVLVDGGHHAPVTDKYRLTFQSFLNSVR